MQIFKDIDLVQLNNTVVTTGNFDGVHLGHQYLLNRLVEHARGTDRQAVVVMFYPHPREVLSKGVGDFSYLSSQEDKYSMFERCGVDVVMQIPFSLELAKWSADQFVKRILIDKLGMSLFLVGFDHRLGNPKSDTRVAPLAEKYNFEMKECSSFVSPVGEVSSSIVKESLELGDVERTASLLGRKYAIRCIVVEGMKVGRSIGYPTANLRAVFSKKLIPAEGVYAVQIDFQGEVYGGMLQVGYRPTLDDGRGLTVEVHIFDFEKNIYGQQLVVKFVSFLRKNQKFSDINALRLQLKDDERLARIKLNLM